MDILREVMYSCLNIPYKWGGKCPSDGLDCSGFVEHVLRSAGMKPPGTHSSQELFDLFSKQFGVTNQYSFGSLCFFGVDVKQITHVGFVLDPYRFISASGGDHLTITKEDAIKVNACVRVDVFSRRQDLAALVRIGYAKIGIP